MSRRLRPAFKGTAVLIESAIDHLKEARAQLKWAGCPQTLKKLRSTIESAEGALRHAHRREDASR